MNERGRCADILVSIYIFNVFAIVAEDGSKNGTKRGKNLKSSEMVKNNKYSEDRNLFKNFALSSRHPVEYDDLLIEIISF